MAKAKTKEELEKELKKLKQEYKKLQTEYNESVINWSKRYNELNEKKGDVIGYEQIKQSLERKELMYDTLERSYKKEQNERMTLHDELRKMKLQYNDLQAEHEQLQTDYTNLSNKYNAIIGTKREKGRPKKEVRATAEEIKEMMKTKTAEQVAEDLGISRMTLFRRLKSNKNK